MEVPFPDSHFAAVSSFGVLQILQDWKQGLREIQRVLAPGGIALIETNRKQPWIIFAVQCLVRLTQRTDSVAQIWNDILLYWRRWRKPNPAFDSIYFDPNEILQFAIKQGWEHPFMISIEGATPWKPGWVFGLILYKAQE